jgi:hypothetical protein
VIKLGSLLEFLLSVGSTEEYSYLYKIAHDETPEDALKKHPVFFKIFEKSTKPAGAFLSILNRMTEDQKSEVDESMSFEDLIGIMRKEKEEDKLSRESEILNVVKSIGHEQYGEDSETISSAFTTNNMSDEHIEYILKDNTNHSIFDKINFVKEMISVSGGEKSVYDFADIDEIVSFILGGMKKESLEGFYGAIENNAKSGSEILYNSNKYTVILSKTGYAAKYWEQSSVTVDKDGTFSSGLCTALPTTDTSHFDEYTRRGHIVQIITKSLNTEKISPLTRFNNHNRSLNLISMVINHNGDISFGGSKTVNRNNEDVTLCDIFYALEDEFDDIFLAIGEKVPVNTPPVDSCSIEDCHLDMVRKVAPHLYADRLAASGSGKFTKEILSGQYPKDEKTIESIRNILRKECEIFSEHGFSQEYYGVSKRFFSINNIVNMLNFLKDFDRDSFELAMSAGEKVLDSKFTFSLNYIPDIKRIIHYFNIGSDDFAQKIIQGFRDKKYVTNFVTQLANSSMYESESSRLRSLFADLGISDEYLEEIQTVVVDEYLKDHPNQSSVINTLSRLRVFGAKEQKMFAENTDPGIFLISPEFMRPVPSNSESASKYYASTGRNAKIRFDKALLEEVSFQKYIFKDWEMVIRKIEGAIEISYLGSKTADGRQLMKSMKIFENVYSYYCNYSEDFKQKFNNILERLSNDYMSNFDFMSSKLKLYNNPAFTSTLIKVIEEDSKSYNCEYLGISFEILSQNNINEDVVCKIFDMYLSEGKTGPVVDFARRIVSNISRGGQSPFLSKMEAAISRLCNENKFGSKNSDLSMGLRRAIEFRKKLRK